MKKTGQSTFHEIRIRCRRCGFYFTDNLTDEEYMKSNVPVIPFDKFVREQELPVCYKCKLKDAKLEADTVEEQRNHFRELLFKQGDRIKELATKLHKLEGKYENG